jgi:hypothetical protein
VRPVHTQPSRQERLRFLRMTSPTWKSCDKHAATADLSESNHDDFRKIPDSPRGQHALLQLSLTFFLRISGCVAPT